MGQIKKVLIAEDSPTQALKLQMILEDKNYEVLHGKDGMEALSLIDEDDPPDLVISDVVMPEMDGYEFCSRIKQNEKTRKIPVILLTQLSNPEDVIKGLQAGADNFISKPYTNEFLFERISDILLNREMRSRSPNLDISMEIYFGGQKYKLNSDRLQILDLLLSTYYNAINQNRELEQKNEELKRLHKELKLNNEKLQKLNDEKNQLLGIAAHDLRSPLGNISSYIDLIEYSIDENTFDDQEDMFQTMKMMLDHMLGLISDVLDYSKIEAGKLDLQKEQFNLIQFLNRTIKLSNILGSAKNITVQPHYSMEEITIEADFKKLKQVMDNLLSNAFKYSKRGTTVEVDVKVLEKEVQISVADQGQGIPGKELNKLFQPFSTTSVRTTEGEQSTGLGLVSVKKIVETHGGRIWVESAVGLGSIFYFTLPYDPVKNKKADSGSKNNDIQEKLNILIVEDDEISEQFLSVVSFDISNSILKAKNGLEAIKACQIHKNIDLILMDLKMPRMNGIEATREIRKFNKDVIIIAQSSHANEDDKKSAIEAGCNDFIDKPIFKERILELYSKHK